MPTQQKNPNLVPLAIIVGALVIGVCIIIAFSHGTPGSGTAATQAVNIKDVKTTNDPYIGKADAPATLAYWSDYQCPFCKAFEVGGVQGIDGQPAMPDLVKNYVDTGKLKIVFKDFPFLGNDSITAAEYARAVWDLYPNQFYAWRTAMFVAQDQEGDQGFGNAATIDQLIKTKFPQMDDARITSTVSSKKAAYDASIMADRQEGESFGITGTPGFITGQQLIGGYAGLSTFTAAIDPQLK